MTRSDPAHTEPAADAVDAILADCLDVPLEQLPAAVAAACERHPELADTLRLRAEALLSLRSAGRSAESATPAHPGALDRFRLLHQIGGGGMGVVYLAVEEPLQRRVALKVIRHDLLFFPGARQRFLREVAAIATLDHPGIVPIYAYGEAQGVPYYAMQLVDGRSLTAVLQDLRGRDPSRLEPALLSLGRAANWVEACCQIVHQAATALAHAHARGIVHRDIKPSNLMLTADGRVLLIDFGLAHVEGGEQLTRSGGQPGSPAYMAPEQVRGARIDARTDVYALGVVLYELLTLLPAYSETTEQGIRQCVLAADVVPIRHRNRKAPQDAVTIVTTAMAPEPTRRYQTAELLAQDLGAFLEHRPIAARPAGPLLRLRRFTQRRPTLVTAVVLLTLLLVGLPTALLLQERSARRAIERQMDSVNHVVRAFGSMFAEAEPGRARGASVPVRTILDAGVQRVREDLRDEPEARAKLLDELGAAYLTLGLLAEGEPLLEDARQLHEQLGHDGAAKARNTMLRAQLLQAKGQYQEARVLLLQLLDHPGDFKGDEASSIDVELRLATCEALLGHLDAAARRYQDGVAEARARFSHTPLLAQALQSEATFLLVYLEQPTEAGSRLQEAWQICSSQLLDEDPRLISLRVQRANTASALGDNAAAEQLLQHALASAQKVHDVHHPQLAQVREELAYLYLATDRPADAMPMVDLVLAAYRATHTPPHPLLASAASLEASCALDIGDLPRASRAASAALAMYEQLPERQSHHFAGALVNLGRVRTEMGDLDDGIALCRRALQMLGKIERPSLQTSARAHAWLGRALALSNQWQEGYAEAERAVDIASKATLAPPSLLPHMQVTKAMVCLMCGDAKAAAPAAAAALQGFAAIRPDGAGVGSARFALGWAANMRGEPKAAEPLLRDALAILLRCYGASHPFTATVRCELGVSLARQGQLTEAAPMFEQAYAVQLAAGKDDNPFLIIPAINLAYLRSAEGQKQAAARLAMQVLQIQSRHRLQNDLRTPMAIDLLLQTLDAVADGAERRGLQQQLVQCTEALLPAADKLRRKVAEAAMHW